IPQVRGEPLKIETRDDEIWLVEGGTSPEFKDVGPDYIIPPAAKDSPQLRKSQEALPQVVPEPVVEVVVVYTPALVTVMGSNAAVQARIVQLEAISNQAYVDSQAEVRIKVLASHLVDYTVNNDNNVALSEIRSPSALPIKFEVDRLRTQYGADLVAMVRNFDRSTQNSCGIAYLLGYNGSGFASSYGFSVTSDRGFGGDNCGDFTFAHELGHNMGAAHDFDTEEGDSGAYPYSRGYRQDVGDGGFATVMAYPRRPQVRIGTFSNPRLSTCLGLPCGLADSADNARGLGQSAPIIANFRASVSQAGPSLSISDVFVTEGAAGTRNARFTVSLSSPAASAVTFDLLTSHGTATGSDYTARIENGLSIPAGQTSLSFDVVVNGDLEVEFDEVFALNARNVSGAWVLDGQGVATITNDEPIPDLSVANISIGEGDSGTLDATFTALLSAPSTTPVTFDFASQAYSAASNTGTADIDFGLVTGTGLVIPAGATSAQFTVPVFGDVDAEQDEAFYVIASNVQAAVLVDGMATAWIRDDDDGSPQPTISIASASTSEGNAGTKTLDFSISLSQPAAASVGFGATTADITASAGNDYVASTVSGLSIPAGATGATFSVTINGDTASESNETFSVTLNNVTGADPGTLQATGTINNDDAGGAQPILAARDDRRVMRENGAATSLDVRANDEYDAARLAGGSLSIIAAPGKGSASVNTAGTAGTAADDLVVYTPQAGAIGDDSLRYRLCEGSGGRCVEATARIVLRPLVDVSLETTTGRGFADLTLEGLAAMPDALFSVTRAARAQRLERALGADSTTQSPWDDGMAGTAVIAGNFAPSQGPTGPIDTQARVLVDANAINGADIDLYMGLDLDGDGQAEASEVRCVSATSAAVERCELALQIAAGDAAGVDYWTMVHSRSGAAQSARLDIYRASLEEV
ncbi:MAG TPA: M12 family metallo-peptidase, partial [Arenimonas sp.]|nr:M12 family metallo-peptidase [Arenimonas sp.]